MTLYQARVDLALTLQVDAADIEGASAAARTIIRGTSNIREEHIRGVVVAPIAVDDLRTERIRLWQETEALALGTSDQVTRWHAGVLPELELLELARPVLFGAFSAFRKRAKMSDSAIPHPRGADGVWTCLQGDSRIVWSTLPRPDLTETEWATLLKLRDAVAEACGHPWFAVSGTAATLDVRLHKGVCQTCGREAAEASALVAVQWAGRTLTREYCL